MLDHIAQRRKEISDNIQKSYNPELEKAGEGSRGGKVIGHTKSGNPIYLKNLKASLQKRFKDPENQEHHDEVYSNLKTYLKDQGVQDKDIESIPLMEDEMYGGGDHNNVDETISYTDGMIRDLTQKK